MGESYAMKLQQSIFKRVTRQPFFRNKSSFRIAVALTAFNFFIIGAFFVLAKVFDLPDPVTQARGVASIGDLMRSMVLAALWSIGDAVLLLAFLQANREPPEQ